MLSGRSPSWLMDGWMNARIDGGMEGQMEGWKDIDGEMDG